MTTRDETGWLIVAVGLGLLWVTGRPSTSEPPQERGELPPDLPPPPPAPTAPASTSRPLTFLASINVDGLTRALAGGSAGIGHRLQADLPGLVRLFNAQHKGTLSHATVAHASDAEYGTDVAVTATYDGAEAPEHVVQRLHELLLSQGQDVAQRLRSLSLA